jgi:hypothetical protein
VGWIESQGVHLWSKQREIVEAVRDHRQVAVHSAHDMGKSFVVAQLMAQWITCSEPGESFVVSTAPTFPQVRAILWRELNRAKRRGGLPGKMNQTEWQLSNELVAFGRKPADHDPGAFQGIHARRVLVVFDEADDIPEELWTAATGLVTTEWSRWVAIGNPDDPYSSLAERCKPGSGWHVIHVDGLKSPNFTDEVVPQSLSELLLSPIWVAERELEWGVDDPRYLAKVRGLYSKGIDNERQIIPTAWVEAAQARWRAQPKPTMEMTAAGVDPARGGADVFSIAPLYGTWFAELIQASGKVIDDGPKGRNFVQKHVPRGVPLAIDSEGIGTSPTDFLREAGWYVVPIVAGSGAPTRRVRGKDVPITDPSGQYIYLNLRSYLWLTFRDALNPITGANIALPPGNDILRQFTEPRYELRKAAYLVESKDDLRKASRMGRSPDDADAIIQAWYCSKLRRPDAAPIHVQTVSDRRGKARW